MIWGIIAICIIIFIIILYIISTKIKRVKPALEVIYILISLFTIVSIIFAVEAYYDQKKIREDNERIILENLKEEIKFNNYLIKSIILDEEYFRTSDAFTSGSFNYYYLEKSLDIIEDKNLRRDIMKILDAMQQANRIIDDKMRGGFTIYQKENYNLYMVKKNEWINSIMDIINFTSPLLKAVDNSLTERGY